jgi:N-acetylglucosaminyldiphosphoundecaprenol N-acetyl-beta-D-mannosaminyltransferase
MNSQYESATIFGVKIHIISVGELIDFIMESAGKDGQTVIENVNVRALNIAYEISWFKDFINQSNLVFCDGVGVILGARLSGYKISMKHRMTCADFLDTLANECAEENRSLFLLAGCPGVAEKAAYMLSLRHPSLKVGYHHGYFRKDGEENENVLDELEKFHPDLLFIGFGMPLQERWISDNLDRLHSRVILPLGACLDIYTGKLFRGPKWMTDNGMEWLGRLFTESPKRVWARYLIGIPLFFYRILKDKLKISKTQSL